MHDMHEATEVLLQTAREYGSSNARGGDVVAAAYRLVATKIREHGYQDLAKELEHHATQAEKILVTRPSYATSEGTLTAWAVLALTLVVFTLMLGGCA